MLALPLAAGAVFIFSTESGAILGWNGGDAATQEVDASPSGAVSKGLAIATTPSGTIRATPTAGGPGPG